ncbi:hypothetical protein DFR31_1159 [Alkalispirillum mobile]|uniref:DUF2066 domain-containing protein n=1 Tax=Alkalispirillum mobile TaxID=85925 RepID=A0A498C7Y5_9GAMM|nr:DUF2066 domain-containing protein [Alkalispirillum mobile]RLK51237.1 hypothetical protein DFR31_1159 [Alkalispirillum mobile]
MRLVYLTPLLLIALMALPAGAAPFYTVEVSAETRSDEDRGLALKAALARQLQRMTGTADPAEAEALADLMLAPEQLLAGYAWRGEAGEDLRLQARFDPEALQAALADYTGEVWLGEGARVIVWAGEEVDGSRNLMAEGSGDTLAERVRAEAAAVGLTPLLPLLDLEDRRNLEYSHIWAGFTDRIAEASQRYGAQPVVTLALRERSGGDWEGRWLLLDGRSTGQDRGQADSREELVQQAMQWAVTTLAQARGVVLAGEAQASLDIRVAIDSLSAYAAVLEYLQGLPEVREARLAGTRGDALALELDLAVSPERALSALEGSRSLEPQAEGETGEEAPPRFRWRR